MKEHFCPVEQSMIAYEGECNWCGEREGSMTQEALKLALEALEDLNNTNSYWWQEVDQDTIDKIEPAITAIKEALAQTQEPVAWISPKGHIHFDPYLDSVPLYTSPPQRTWVGLTEQEAAECWSTSTVRTWQAIEAKLKEKNT